MSCYYKFRQEHRYIHLAKPGLARFSQTGIGQGYPEVIYYPGLQNILAIGQNAYDGAGLYIQVQVAAGKTGMTPSSMRV